MSKKIIIVGGGVAGMSAAHELIERNFEVKVFELKSVAGGKARSINIPYTEPLHSNSRINQRKKSDENISFPAEHGFRFFPGFYKHLSDTMRRTPFYNYNKSVFDNLVPVTKIGLTRHGKPPMILNTKAKFFYLSSLKIPFTNFGNEIGIPRKEILFFAKKIWQLMTSSGKRRVEEYEKIGWWKYLEGDSKSEEFKKFFISGFPRSLVAAQPDIASTHTFGKHILQLMYSALDPSIDPDRVLNGPTNEAWIEPWLKYLMDSGVEYHLNSEVIKFNYSNNKISSVTIKKDGKIFEVQGDYYIAALPVEVMAALTTEEMSDAYPVFNNIKKLAKNVVWMNGIQIYLKNDAKAIQGHEIHLDSRWALTSLLQHQFWSDNFKIDNYGDDDIKGIISVVISDWNTNGLNGKKAIECNREEIFNEVWNELKLSTNINGKEILKDEYLHSYYLDEDIIFENGPDDPNPKHKINAEPLLVNLVNTWDLRPASETKIQNLFLAADYIKTNTDLATMEAANEAARQAVNGILNREGLDELSCKIWELEEPEILAYWQEQDAKRFEKGLPWKMNFSPLIILSYRFWYHMFRFIFKMIRKIFLNR